MEIYKSAGRVLALVGTGLLLTSSSPEISAQEGSNSRAPVRVLQIDTICTEHRIELYNGIGEVIASTQPRWHVDVNAISNLPTGSEGILRFSSRNERYEVKIFAPRKTARTSVTQTFHVMGELQADQPLPPRFVSGRPYLAELYLNEEKIAESAFTGPECDGAGPDKGTFRV